MTLIIVNIEFVENIRMYKQNGACFANVKVLQAFNVPNMLKPMEIYVSVKTRTIC